MIEGLPDEGLRGVAGCADRGSPASKNPSPTIAARWARELRVPDGIFIGFPIPFQPSTDDILELCEPFEVSKKWLAPANNDRLDLYVSNLKLEEQPKRKH